MKPRYLLAALAAFVAFDLALIASVVLEAPPAPRQEDARVSLELERPEPVPSSPFFRSALAGPDGQPNGPGKKRFTGAGLLYMASPAALSDGQEDELRGDSHGSLKTTQEVLDSATAMTATVTSGVTAQTIVTGTASKSIYPILVVIDNEEASAAHTVILHTSGGSTAGLRFRILAGDSKTFPISGWKTASGDDLVVECDSSNAANKVYVSGAYVVR